MIFGFTGPFGSGKGTAIKFLKTRYGAVSFSLGDEVREETKRRGLGVERHNLISVGNEMRKKHGAGYWAARVSAKAKKALRAGKKLILIDSIRAPEEVKEFRRQFGKSFILISIDAPLETRYGRIGKRARAKEELLSIKEFKKSERAEQSAKAGEANIPATMKLADFTVVNDSTEKKLQEKITKILEGVDGGFSPKRA